MIALGFAKLWGWPWGLVALAGMTLIYHEPNAPLYVWLNVLAAVALLRVLPPGRLQTLIKVYRGLALLALLTIGALFAVQQVRGALYPQLEPFAPGAALVPVHSPASAPPVAALESASSAYNRLQSLPKKPATADPEQAVAAAPAAIRGGHQGADRSRCTDWRWQRATLHWSGPVATDEPLRLWLLPPWGHAGIAAAGSGLLLAMGRGFRIAGRRTLPQPRRLPVTKGKARIFSAGRCCGGIGAAGDGPSRSPRHRSRRRVSPPEILKQLRERLIQPPDCQRCGDLAALALTVRNDALQLRLSLHAQTDTVVPLPLPREGLIVRAIDLDGRPATLFRGRSNCCGCDCRLGLHTATVAATVLPEVATLQLPLPLPPGRLELDASGWKVEGHVEGRVDPQLQLIRRARMPPRRCKAGVMPPFVQVERDLVLDVDWQVLTRVRRLSQADQAAVLEIPAARRARHHARHPVRDNRVLLSLPPEQTEIRWTATLSRVNGTDPSGNGPRGSGGSLATARQPALECAKRRYPAGAADRCRWAMGAGMATVAGRTGYPDRRSTGRGAR